MGDGDKRSLLWSPEEILPVSEKDTKGKQKVGSDFFPDFPNGLNTSNHDVRIAIGSAGSPVSDEATVSREELPKIWTPEPPLVPDDRVRRSSLWDSAVGLGDDFSTFSEDSEGKIREETRAGKRVGEIEAADERPLLLPQSDTDSDVDSRGRSHIELSQINVTNALEEEESSSNFRTEMKDWVKQADKRRNSMAERLSELLRPRPASVADTEVKALEKKETLDAGKEKRVSQLNHSSTWKKKNSIAKRMPPEWVLLLLGCLLGLSSGISVVIFNKGVCLL